jgi:hypothetical protein
VKSLTGISKKPMLRVSLLRLSYAGNSRKSRFVLCLGSFLLSPGYFNAPSELKFLVAQENSMQLNTSPVTGKSYNAQLGA